MSNVQIWLQFRKREDGIRSARASEVRNRNDSVSDNSAWSKPSYLFNSRGTSLGMSRSHTRLNGPPIPERSARLVPVHSLVVGVLDQHLFGVPQLSCQ